MTPIITVGYFGHHTERCPIHNVAFHYIKRIKDENKSKIKFKLMYNQDDEHWKELYTDITNHGIQAELIKFKPVNDDGSINCLNYYEKCRELNNSDSDICCKMDEDIWISNHSWDFIIENASNLLKNPTILCFSPIISNGVPTTDIYIQNNFTEEENKQIRDLFYKQKIDNMWGVDYSGLSEFHTRSSYWNPQVFYELVEQKIHHHYKGVHPGRFSKESQMLINDYTINHYDKISELQDYSDVYLDMPTYLCNTFYFIKKDWFDAILKDSSVWPAGNAMDEVPLNLFRRKHNLYFAYINNLNCVHLFYNGIENHTQLELEYLEKYKKVIK
jgi:hypothetical protein